MEKILLKSQVREETGKSSGSRLRKSGKIPGILYGHKEDPISLIMDEHNIREIIHNAQTKNIIITLEIEGVDIADMVTIVKDVQHHPVTGDILHVDFMRVAMDEKIDVNVPVRIIGMAKGVTEEGGVLYHSIRQIMINSTPAEIPESIDIDVSELTIGSTIHISDIVGNYKEINFVSDLDMTLVHIAAPKEADLPEEEVVEEGAEVAEGEEESAGEEKETEKEQDKEGS